MKTESKSVLSRLFNIRIMAVVGVLVLIISYLSFSGESNPKFKDVDNNHWASKEINYLTERQVIAGYPDGTFKPSQSITRLQAVMMILREKGIEAHSWDVEDPGFIDVRPGDYGYEIIAKSAELGIINGKVNEKGQRYFDPSGKLTRAQMASILTNAYDLEGSDNVVFSDVPKNHWAYNAIQALAKNKIAFGYGNGKYGANDNITRAQFAVMMARILDETFLTTPTPSQPSEPIVEPTNPNTGGEVYPDGWVAPVLESAWSSNQAVNYQTLQNELGFKDDGRRFAIPEFPQGVIHVVGQGGTDVDITFFGWEDTSVLPNSYRVPIVAKELFKLYFGGDANQVWNYFDRNDIPEEFTANGFNVTATYSSATGGITLKLR